MSSLYDKKLKKLILPQYLILGFLCSVAFIIRVYPYKNFIDPEGGFYFYNVDSYEHLRRITLGIESFPNVPSFDFYAGYPYGLGQIWSPLFDYILTIVSIIFGGTKEAVDTICFLSNPFFTLLTIIAVFLAAKKTFKSEAAGLVAAFLISVMPPHISTSLPMNFDHHVIEPLIVLLLFSIPFFENEGRLEKRQHVYMVAIILSSMFLWRGSTLYLAPLFASVVARCWLYDNRRLAHSYGYVFLATSLLLALYCYMDPWGRAYTISFREISWFHVITLLLFSSFLFLYRAVTGKRTALILISMIIPLALMLSQPFRSFLMEAAEGILFIFKRKDAWLSSITEQRPVFSGKSNFIHSASYLTIFWFITPLAASLAFIKWRRDRNKIYLLNFIIWSPLFILGLIIRYGAVASLFASLTGGYLFSLIWRRCDKPYKKALAVISMFILLLPGYAHYKNSLSVDIPPYMSEGLYGADGILKWIRKKTPETSYYLNPATRPEYGILADWTNGARIYQLARRPVMATAFGWEAHGLYQTAAFMVSTDSKVAHEILRENRIKYILLQASKSLKNYYDITRSGEKKGKLPVGTSANFEPGLSSYRRLMYYDGSSGKTRRYKFPALPGYRLLFESSYLANRRDLGNLSYFKLFEFVEGAKIYGKAPPFAEINIRLKLSTSRGRKMSYYDYANAAEDGRFEFSLPYSTEKKQGDTEALGKYELYVNGILKTRFEILEEDVLKGVSIFLPG